MQWGETALGALYFAVMARYLGPALYGEWAYGIAAYVLIVGLVGLNFESLLILRLGRDKADAAEFLGLTLTLRLTLLGIGAVGLAAYALAAVSDPLATVLLLLVPALVGRGIAGWVRGAFLAYERMGDYIGIVAMLRAAEACCGVLYLIVGGGLLGVVALHALTAVGEAFFGLWRIRSRLTGFALGFGWHPAREVLAQGAVLGTAAVGYNWLVSGPIMLLRHSGLGWALLGQFALVSSLTMILVGSAHAFFSAALPVLSRSVSHGDAGVTYGRLTALAVAAVACVATLVAWLLGPPVATWALGPGYAIAGGLLGLFLPIGGLILAPAGYAQILLLADCRWLGAVSNIAAGLWLTAAFPPASAAWGLDGAVAATAGAWLIRATILIGWAEWRRSP